MKHINVFLILLAQLICSALTVITTPKIAGWWCFNVCIPLSMRPLQ